MVSKLDILQVQQLSFVLLPSHSMFSSSEILKQYSACGRNISMLSKIDTVDNVNAYLCLRLPYKYHTMNCYRVIYSVKQCDFSTLLQIHIDRQIYSFIKSKSDTAHSYTDLFKFHFYPQIIVHFLFKFRKNVSTKIYMQFCQLQIYSSEKASCHLFLFGK